MRLAHERVGAGEPVVVLNGFAATRADWDPGFLDALAGHRELVLVDNRGMGASPADGAAGGQGAAFTVQDMAADVAELIEALGLDRPCVLGWSLGGMVTLALVLARPDLVGSLILLSTHSGSGQAPIPPDAAARLRDLSSPPSVQARGLISVLFSEERAAEIEAAAGSVVAEARAALDPDAVERQWDALQAWSRGGATARLGEIRCPTLVATGTDDAVCPAQNAEFLAAGISNSWLARFPRCGHAFMADRPVALAGLIVAFLAAHR